MNLDAIPAGKNPPSDINVVIEITGGAGGGAPVKYEIDKDSGAVFVDRIVSTFGHEIALSAVRVYARISSGGFRANIDMVRFHQSAIELGKGLVKILIVCVGVKLGHRRLRVPVRIFSRRCLRFLSGGLVVRVQRQFRFQAFHILDLRQGRKLV